MTWILPSWIHMVDNVRITFLVVSLIVAILAFLYPLSSFSGMIDERDLSLKPQKKGQDKPQAKANARSRAPQAPVNAQPAVMPDGTVAVNAQQPAAYIPEEQYVEPAPQYSEPMPQAPAQQAYQAPVEQQYQQPANQYQQQYQQPYEQAYQEPYQQQYTQQYQQPAQYQDPYQQPVQQYQAPADQYQQYQNDPYGSQYSNPAAPQMPQGGMNADPYAGSGPSPYDTTASQGPVDPLAFLNNDGNEGGNQ